MAPRPSTPRIDTAAPPAEPRRAHARPRSRTLEEQASPASNRPSHGRSASVFAEGLPAEGEAPGGATLRRQRRDASSCSASSTNSLATGASASDSAYATLDEHDSSVRCDGDTTDDAVDFDGESALLSPASERDSEWRDRVVESFKARSRRRVQAAVGVDGWRLRTTSEAGDGLYWRRTLEQRRSSLDNTAQSSPDIAQEPVFSFDITYDADSSYESLDFLSSPLSTVPSATLSLCSSRSSPEPSECGEAEPSTARLTMPRKRQWLSPVVGETAEESAASFLARRHTLPRRTRAREPTRKTSRTSLRQAASRSSVLDDDAAPVRVAEANETAQAATVSPVHAAMPVTRIAAVLSLAVSLVSAVSSTPLIAPVSPVHLRHPTSALDFATQAANAAFAPFLVQPSAVALALAAVNLYLLGALERSKAHVSARAKAAVAAASWTAIVGLRALFSWLFGRALGWAHPQFLSTRAIHEVGSGLAPVLLCLSLMIAASTHVTKPVRTSHCAVLGASFAVPAAHGGPGLWLGLSAAIVGLVGFLVISTYRVARPLLRRRAASASTDVSKLASHRPPTWSSLFALLLLPALALHPTRPAPSAAHVKFAFSQLHPHDSNLLTVLLMTAPRPGNPDFLLQTVESWLGAFPNPDSGLARALSTLPLAHNSSAPPAPPLSSRLRLVVYTHFASHPMFDVAQMAFSKNAKAAHYIEWHRDPRAFVAPDRFDQRLHVARGLDYAASKGGAYVLLTEDDFPLCEDEAASRVDGRKSWSDAWHKLQAALVRTNALMPDSDVPVAAVAQQPDSLGHCGLFLATGGSGLAIRTPLAARLPALLLGPDDPHGYAREAAAARGEVVLKREGEGADTPDLVIQDCLRGRLPECAVCAPGVDVVGPGVGTARRPGGVLGDRVGKSGLAGTERLLQRHLGYNASTLPGRKYGREEWACGWRQPFNGDPDVLTV
ncbi:hypothetical protein Rhopal_004788-T1 [Rhodotorula paludigena]|uniref:Proteophosphoglycan ppg4 n=1 Tax=Rhodotorula paludigena TaxID=86838 RepID=A0AAV5GPE9_9BASI|nr:hypothetical protein Rhopal_004788-T1 [Rhodotorula paludigena]